MKNTYVLFTSVCCVPCKVAKIELSGLEIEIHDVSTSRKLSLKCGVQSVPTLVAIDANGRPIDTFRGGMVRKKVEQWMSKLEAHADKKEVKK